MKLLILGLFLFGVYLVVLSQVRLEMKKKRVSVEYIPRTFKESQENEARVTELFDGMFNGAGAWLERTLAVDDNPRRVL